MLKSYFHGFPETLNPRQRRAAAHVEGPLLVRAGSGKIGVNTHRTAHLMTAHRVPGWTVPAVTFRVAKAVNVRSENPGALST